MGHSRFLLLAVLLGGISFAGTGFVSSPCNQPLPDGAKFEDVAAEIETCQITHIDDLIPLLPDALRSHYALMHHSLSLQKSTPDAPRAILYGKDAKLIVAFNGDPSEIRYNHLEAIQYREDTKRFEFHDVTFLTATSAPGTKVQFSAPNPELCLTCHKSDPRPNWSSYPLWAGAYGGEDDSVYRDPADRTSSDGKAYAHFLAGPKKTGRYQYLKDIAAGELVNTNLGSYAQKWNEQRISRLIADAPALTKFRYALLGAATCFYSDHYSDVQGFVPDGARTKFPTTFAAVYKDTASTNRANFVGRVQSEQKIYPLAPENSLIQELMDNIDSSDSLDTVGDTIVAGLRWIAENNGVSTEEWSTEFYPPAHIFESGYTGIADLRIPLAETLLTSPQDSALLRELEQPQISSLDDVCAELHAKSLAAFAPPARSR